MIYDEKAVTGQELFQERTELAHNVPDKLCKLMERWEQRITVSNRRLDERFIRREIHILIRFRTSDTGKEWFVCAESYAGRLTHHELGVSNGEYGAMLVGIVEASEQPQRIVPSLVWLKPINRLYGFEPHTLYFSNLSGFITLRAMKNRKLDVLPLMCSWSTANQNKLVGQVIKGASEIVNDISGYSGNGVFIKDHRNRFKKWLAGIRIKIKPNVIEGGFVGPQDSILQFGEVLVGPFNFYADQSKSVVGGHEGTGLPAL